MILLTNLTAVTLEPGQSLIFDRAIISLGCNQTWRNPSGAVSIRRRGVYNVDFSANIGGPTAATAVQLSIQLGGSTLPETTMISTPAAAGDLNNVSRGTAIPILCGDYRTITVVNTGTTTVNVGAGSSLRIERIP